MSQKRKKSETDQAPEPAGNKQKAKKGFAVGPDNLPDGTYRRKAQKIKFSLIHKAKVKKSYAKLKERERPNDEPVYNLSATSREENLAEKAASPTLDLHPERKQMLRDPPPLPALDTIENETIEPKPCKPPRTRPRPFLKESQVAQQKREEAEARRQAIEDSKRQRQEKLADRERLRKMTAAARKPNMNGQRRLGRESKVLLERVKKLVGE